MIRIREFVLLALAASMLLAGGLEAPAFAQVAQPGARIAAPAPLVWTEITREDFVVDPRIRWILIVEETLPGWSKEGGLRRPLRQTRLRIQSAAGRGMDGGLDLAVLQHLSNTEVALLPAGDPRLIQPAIAIDDPRLPWPNTCALEVHHLPRPLDLNEDDRNDLVVKQYATAADWRTEGLLLVGSDTSGNPSILDPFASLAGVRGEELILTRIEWREKRSGPTLYADHAALQDCRFLAQLGIRGEAQCSDCCRVPIVIEQAQDGLLHATYFRAEQKPLLDRLQSDLKRVGTGDPTQPLGGEQEAALARAGAFLYLTGAGARARATLIDVLEARSAQYRVQVLLDRIERYFTTTAAATDSGRAEDRAAPPPPP